jgi:hypothetical protein
MRILYILLIASITAASAVAEPFVPEPLELSVPHEILSFIGTDAPFSVPVTVSGNPASIAMALYTRDDGEGIGNVWHSSSLGWRYTSEIDTCVYGAPPKILEPGAHTLTYDNLADLYPATSTQLFNETYFIGYVWAYDHTGGERVTPPGLMQSEDIRFVDHDVYGNPLDAPYFQTATTRWYIGDDPEQPTHMETSVLPLKPEWHLAGAPLPWTGTSIVYSIEHIPDTKWNAVRRYEWVPDGESTRDTEWGEDLEWEYWGDSIDIPGNIETDGEYLFTFNAIQNDPDHQGAMYIFDEEAGEMLFDFVVPRLHPVGVVLQDGTNTAPPRAVYKNGSLTISSAGTFLQTFDPARYMESEVADDLFRWISTERLLAPAGEDVQVTAITKDSLEFTIASVEGSASGDAVLVGPDGSEIMWLDLFSGMPGKNGRMFLCDSGSEYDGFYVERFTDAGEHDGIWYVGADVQHFHGDIVYSYNLDSVRLTSPNGGERFVAGTEFVITWYEWYTQKTAWSYTPPPTKLSLSVDGGETWETIFDGRIMFSTKFVVPAVDSDRCLVRVDYEGTSDTSDAFFTIATGTGVADNPAPTAFSAGPALPNPFNPTTVIPVELPVPGNLRATVFALNGQQVAVIADGHRSAGRHSLTWEAAGCAAGVYLCMVEHAGMRRVVRMTLMK